MTNRITIIDYGMGNLRSVQKALENVGAKTRITQNIKDVERAEKLVLPGVGAMQPAMDKLNELGLIAAIKDFLNQKKPFLGICLGFQLLFDKSDEGGEVQGLGICSGRVKKFTSLKVPHIGWNQLQIQKKDCPLFKGLNSEANVYFCHSYYAEIQDKNLAATITDYGISYASSIWKDNLFGVQFHPEKSQVVGLKILENFQKL